MKNIFFLIFTVFIFCEANAQIVNPIYGKQEFRDSIKVTKYKNSTTIDSIISTDQYGIFKQLVLADSIIAGGFTTEATISDRNSIGVTKRKVNMIVSVRLDTSIWQLIGGISNTNWVRKYLSNPNSVNVVINSSDSLLYFTNQNGQKVVIDFYNSAGTGFNPSSNIFDIHLPIKVPGSNSIDTTKIRADINTNTANIYANTTTIGLKKNNNDSTGNPGFTTLFQHNKTRDSLQTLIAANATAIAGKFTVVSFGKNSTNDSTIIILSNGSRYAAIDNNGGTGGGGITSQTIVTANGFSGTSTGGATPAITLTTPLNTIVKGNGTALVNAVAGTDYVIPSALTPLAPLASPALTSIPTAPTAAVGTNTTQIATMAALQAGLAANVDPMAISYGLILDTPSTKRLRIDPIISAKVGDSLNYAKYVSINNIDTIKNTKIFKNLLSSDNPTYGSDVSGTGSGTGYTGTVFNTGITHTGGTTPFVGTFTPTAGQFYKISMVSTGITTSSSQFTFGGYVLGIGANVTVNTVWKATSAALPTLIPFVTGADGTITITIQQMTGGTTPYIKVYSASGVLLNEQRVIGSNYLVGFNAGQFTSTLAANNVSISTGGNSLTSGNGNSLLSNGAGTNITIGSYNFAAMLNALSSNVSANFHISIGRNSLDSKVNGDNVIAIGSSGARFISDGVTPYTSGANSMYLGDNTRASSNNVTGETVIGINAVGIGNNTMVLGGPAQVNTVIPYGTFSVPNLTSGSATDSVLTRDATGLFHIRSASAFGGAGGGSVTVFSKTDGFGITSTVTNPTTTPNHTIATDTTVIQSKAGNVGLLALKENSLGNPSTSGYVLSSTSAGVRSWIAPATGGGGGTVTGVFANPPLNITGGSTISPTVNADTSTTVGLQTKFRTDSARTNIYTAIAGKLSSYTETDPIVRAINGVIKSNGSVISAATPGIDFGRVDSIRLVNSGVIHTSGTAFSLVGNTAVLTQTLVSQTANTFLAGPTTGGAVAPTFRAIGPTDVPTLNQSTTGNAATATNLVGLTTSVATLNNQSGTNTGDNATNSQYSGLVTNATHTGDATGATALIVKGINGTLLSGLTTGILKNTTTTGVPSIAVASDFPTLNQSTTGNALTATTVSTINGLVIQGTGTTVTGSGTTASPFVINATATGGVTTAFGRTGAIVATSGDYTTSQVTEVGNLYYNNARGIGSILTGYNSSTGTVSATDNILQAIQKINGNTSNSYMGTTTINSTSFGLRKSNGVVDTVSLAGGAGGTSGINQLTGDGTIPAGSTGSAALTLATVNASNVGTFGAATITVNAKGLITAASSGTAVSTGAFTPTLTATTNIGTVFAGQGIFFKVSGNHHVGASGSFNPTATGLTVLTIDLPATHTTSYSAGTILPGSVTLIQDATGTPSFVAGVAQVVSATQIKITYVCTNVGTTGTGFQLQIDY